MSQSHANNSSFLDDVEPSALKAIEARTREIGTSLFANLDRSQPHVFQRRWWDDRIMSWAMNDEALKVEMFRFVDVLPMLGGGDSVVAHLDEYLHDVQDRLPMPARVALGLARRTSMTRAAVARAARLSAMDFARRFIAGTNTREVLAAAQRERQANRGFTLDILGEAVASEVEAERFFRAYVELIENIAPTVNDWPEVSRIDQGVTGKLPRMNLSIKLSALDSQFDAIDPAAAMRRAGERFRQLLRVARQHSAFINVDMESYDKKSLTLRIFKDVLMEDEFRDIGDVGTVIQCYLQDSEQDLHSLCDWAKRRGKPVWVRLVKGAYWDYETTHAQASDWPIPVYQQKWQSDANFERQNRFLMANYKHLRPALGSHNLRSLAHAMAVAEHFELPDGGFEIQMLYGMADPEKHAIVKAGHRLRIYMPYGELIPGMAYLVRRLLENTSNDSFVRAGLAEQVAPEKLLENPADAETHTTTKPDDSQEVDAMSNEPTAALTATFRNEPPIDFAVEENRQAMLTAIENVKGQLGGIYPLVIGNESVETDQRIDSVDPSFKDRVIGTVSLAGHENCETAVVAAREALPAWDRLGAEQRADYLRRAAQVMRDRFFELSAWEVLECGKEWREATNDVCEAIDFLDFYSQAAVDLEASSGADVPGEENRFHYIPRGVTAVIAPWNFPIAILTGMAAAALATGNTVILKPAEQSPVTAALVMEIFRDLDLPPGVLNYLPGKGEVAGAALVEHPDVALIAFTGSRAVGLAINTTAAQVSATSGTMVKRVIAEMGGKNAVIVDATADLDEAVLGVTHSAFGFQGQKCSACSRAIVLDEVYDAFIERLVEAARSLQVGPAEEPGTVVGPVIDQESQDRVRKYNEIGRGEGREVLAVDVGPLAEQGFFVGPHIYADIAPDARLAQEEVFGPVLAVIRAANLDEAIQIANGTDYALTAGIFSRTPSSIERASREVMVGNFYINRGITGALVGRQPFGGFKMSGIGSKAGGDDYLLQFVLPRTITENTMRRGFAPVSE